MLLGLTASAVWAEQGVGAASQTKINNAKAKAWTDGSIKNPEHQKTVVNIGSRRGGGCSDVNVGTAKAGEKAPKNIVVTTKEVINICK
ncbi:MAG: hypothetical protein A3H93_08895 [Rhodocyclales bacterium RIFCSPLOWO2_02_FULL_63_24]|nr:MAG: hypothetical protein A2040_17545 [Rhodocyclales bacterium GWA2_65_19]OHC72503.1 MAG: hypothetical protein A3H93_08895 [Rhodocyclales bacterium RIFCSPLOWO2_02_FULL_63_24]